jgi:hypothetical protein
MDDFSLSSLQESRNEYCSRLITLLTPCIIDGVKSIFDESWKLCVDNDEKPKYLMTFQNFLTRVPKWNPNIISQECERIKEKSNCSFIPDLITCVHINQLKMLSCMRVGTKQKKVNINVPNLEDFIHKVYINAARKIYTNVYLFETNVSSLKLQKNARDLEIIIRECIVQTIRENIPVEELLKLYMTETIEDAIEVHEKDEIISQEPIQDKNKQAGAAGRMTNPTLEESEKITKEEKEKLEMVKAAGSSMSESSNNNNTSGNTNVSFNMDNNEVISIPANENKHSLLDDNDDDYDIDDDDDDDDGYSENVKLKIGSNVELSVDPFPVDSDSASGFGTDDGDSDVELTIDEIPMIDNY